MTSDTLITIGAVVVTNVATIAFFLGGVKARLSALEEMVRKLSGLPERVARLEVEVKAGACGN